MKKIRFLSVILILALSLCVFPVSAVDEEIIEISDPDTLRAMSAHPESRFILTDDINMAGEPWVPFAFRGELDGAGHAIYNLSITQCGEDRSTSVDGNLKRYDGPGAGLFSSLSGANVHDLRLLNVRVNVESAESCFAALLSGYVADTTVRDCEFYGSVQLISTGIMVGVGGIAGFGTGTFERCHADVELTHVDRRTESHCEQFTGGILACGYCTINDSTVDIRGYTSCHGYVHDGGMIGMHYQFFDPDHKVMLYSRNNTVNGSITFFEDNTDRRAYCAAFWGENLMSSMSQENYKSNFRPIEVFDYQTDLYPHTCGTPDWEISVTEPTCHDFGYTTHRCTLCDYSCRDDYTAPRHVPGSWDVKQEATLTDVGIQDLYCTVCGELLEHQELPAHVAGDWETVTPADYGVPGLRQLRCKDCGALLGEEELPAMVRCEMVTLGANSLKLHYKDTVQLNVMVHPSNADDSSVVWSSSDNDVVFVDAQGNLFARSKGTAVITCASADGGAQAQCRVKVGYSVGQTLIRYLLLGFLWY